MDKNFSERFKRIYQKYAGMITEMGGKPSESGLARFLGVSQTATQRWKKYQVPDAESLKQIHDKLGFAYDWLISGKGEMMDTAAERLATLEAEVAELRNEMAKIKAEKKQPIDGRANVEAGGMAVGQE